MWNKEASFANPPLPLPSLLSCQVQVASKVDKEAKVSVANLEGGRSNSRNYISINAAHFSDPLVLKNPHQLRGSHFYRLWGTFEILQFSFVFNVALSQLNYDTSNNALIFLVRNFSCIRRYFKHPKKHLQSSFSALNRQSRTASSRSST